MPSYHSLVQEKYASETPLTKFRRTLSDQEQAALDKVLDALREYEQRAAQSSQVLPFETLLLMALTEQNERVERLEILLQRLAERVVELYLGTGTIKPQAQNLAQMEREHKMELQE